MKNLQCDEEIYSRKFYGGVEDYAEDRNRSKQEIRTWLALD